jgi:hypothetical protein
MNKFPVFRLIMVSENLQSFILHIIFTGGKRLAANQYSDAAAPLTVAQNILSEVLMLVVS